MVENVALNDGEAGILVRPNEVVSVFRIGEFVENDEFFEVRPLQKLPNESRAYKACAAGYEKGTE